MITLKRSILRFYWLLCQFGLTLGCWFFSFRGLPRYFRHVIHFKSLYAGNFRFRPCLHDWYAEGGSLSHEYFRQDLHVARLIFNANPEIHVDIGSRVDGFVAHVASFREIEVFDIRPITQTVPGIKFKQADFMDPDSAIYSYCDSVSCLHTLEHFGLGRYGDRIDPEGFVIGFQNIVRLLKSGGTFY